MRKRIPEEQKQEGLRLLRLGATLGSAATRAGVHGSSLLGWARIAGVKPSPHRGDVSRYISDNPPTHNGHLSLQGRIEIQLGLMQEHSFRDIATAIEVAPSTVSREVNNNGGREWYSACIAHLDALERRKRFRPGKLEEPALRQLVIDGLNQHWSPEQVSHRLAKEHGVMISHETIYQALYVQGTGALRDELKVDKALRSGRKKRVPQSKLPRRTNKPWITGHELSTRPAEVADRAVPGHWEGDLVIGTDCTSALITLVERQTRFTLIRRLGLGHASLAVTDQLIDMVATVSSELIKTVTWDQGVEMAQHPRFTMATDAKVFFCDPHSPWQRGSNENTNGLIRQFHPKSTNFAYVTDDDIAHTQHLLNTRPRMTLDWDTPAERLDQLLARVALTP